LNFERCNFAGDVYAQTVQTIEIISTTLSSSGNEDYLLIDI